MLKLMHVAPSLQEANICRKSLRGGSYRIKKDGISRILICVVDETRLGHTDTTKNIAFKGMFGSDRGMK